MNSTVTGLSTEGRVALILYNSIVVLCGLSGNVLVLVGSMMYKAIGMDKVSVFLLENVAIADILLILCLYVPKLVSLFTNQWDFGDGMCTVTAFFKYTPAMCEIILIMITGLYR